jgi:hypothetical protein
MDRSDDANPADDGREPTAEAGSTPTEDAAGVFWSGGDDAEPELEPLEPGRPTPENVFFVVLGALGTVALFLTAVSPL